MYYIFMVIIKLFVLTLKRTFRKVIYVTTLCGCYLKHVNTTTYREVSAHYTSISVVLTNHSKVFKPTLQRITPLSTRLHTDRWVYAINHRTICIYTSIFLTGFFAALDREEKNFFFSNKTHATKSRLVNFKLSLLSHASLYRVYFLFIYWVIIFLTAILFNIFNIIQRNVYKNSITLKLTSWNLW